MPVHILVVDDEAAIRRLLTRFLTEAGYTCETADCVEAARKLLSAGSFDLLLCDLKMPGESGLELIRYAKEKFPNVGRIMISGFGSPEVTNEILRIGVYGYIIKPLTKNEVLITVENALRHLRLDWYMQTCKEELEKRVASQIEKNSAIMNNLSVGVVMFDQHMATIELNRMMQRWFPGVSPGAPIPCSHAIQCDMECDDCRDCPMPATFRTGETSEAVRSIRTDKGERDFRIVTSPIFGPDGEVSAGIALYEDITDKLLLERDLHQAQKLEAVGQLAAGIAHEINSPVQYIGDNISFLKDSFAGIAGVLKAYESFWQELVRSGAIGEESQQQLARVASDADLDYLWEEIPKTIDQSLDGVQRIEKIVRAMKDFSHPGDEEKTLLNLNTILQTTITVCRNEWKYVADVETDLADDLPLVPGYAADLSQAFLNIIVNGAHAIESRIKGGSGGKGKIHVSTACDGERVVVRIRDTGGGIPPEIQDRIFEPFFTTKERGKGTGQGLAISRRVIERNQGQLFFETEQGEGTTFSIILPLV